MVRHKSPRNSLVPGAFAMLRPVYKTVDRIGEKCPGLPVDNSFFSYKISLIIYVTWTQKLLNVVDLLCTSTAPRGFFNAQVSTRIMRIIDRHPRRSSQSCLRFWDDRGGWLCGEGHITAYPAKSKIDKVCSWHSKVLPWNRRPVGRLLLPPQAGNSNTGSLSGNQIPIALRCGSFRPRQTINTPS